MTVDQSGPARPPISDTYGDTAPPNDSGVTGHPRADADERRAHDHEHGRLYAELERTAQLAELASHDDMAAVLRALRHVVARCLADGSCEENGVTLKRFFKEKNAVSQKRIDSLRTTRDVERKVEDVAG